MAFQGTLLPRKLMSGLGGGVGWGVGGGGWGGLQLATRQCRLVVAMASNLLALTRVPKRYRSRVPKRTIFCVPKRLPRPSADTCAQSQQCASAGAFGSNPQANKNNTALFFAIVLSPNLKNQKGVVCFLDILSTFLNFEVA